MQAWDTFFPSMRSRNPDTRSLKQRHKRLERYAKHTKMKTAPHCRCRSCSCRSLLCSHSSLSPPVLSSIPHTHTPNSSLSSFSSAYETMSPLFPLRRTYTYVYAHAVADDKHAFSLGLTAVFRCRVSCVRVRARETNTARAGTEKVSRTGEQPVPCFRSLLFLSFFFEPPVLEYRRALQHTDTLTHREREKRVELRRINKHKYAHDAQ